MPRTSRTSRLTALGCVVLAGGLLMPHRAFADPGTRPTPLQDSARRLLQQPGAPALIERAAQAPAAPKTDLRSGSFFKTPAGIATLVIFGAGVGYALYSASNDRIKSAGR